MIGISWPLILFYLVKKSSIFVDYYLSCNKWKK